VILALSGICTDLGRIAFPLDGHYVLQVYGRDSSTGAYRITWQSSRPDKHLRLRADEPVTGNIDFPGAMDVYEFQAESGRALTFTASPNCHRDGGLRWTIQASDGSGKMWISGICDDIGQITFPNTSKYSLRIFSSDAGTGPYKINWH
jgi:hypothetical protein